MMQAPLSGGFFDRLWQLSGGDPFLFWLPVSLMAAAVGLAVIFARGMLRDLRIRRRQEGIETARRIQGALDARYGARCAASVRVALRQGGGISEGFHDPGLYEDDAEFFAGMKSEGRRGWEG